MKQKRLLAILLAVLMITVQPVTAWASDLLERTEQPAVEEALTEETPVGETLTEEVPEAESLVPDLPAEAPELTEEPIEESIFAEKVKNELMSGHITSETAVAAVEKTDYEITRYPARITVENKSSQKDPEHDLYAVLIYADESRQSRDIFFATRISPGSVISLYKAVDEKGNEIPLDTTSKYLILLGRGYEWEDEETGEKHIEDFGLVGWIPEYDAEGNVTYKEYNIQDRAVVTPDSIKEDTDIGWKDGYTGIKMKAAIQKNMQIKISWSPNTKDAQQKTYKKYALFELIKDSTLPTGYSETQRWPVDKSGGPAAPSGSKTATLNTGINKSLLPDSSLIYMLKCYDKDGKELDKYVTTVAPYLFAMQSGFDLTFTQSDNDASMAYILELACKNKESDGVKVTDGFKPEWREEFGCEYLEETYSIGEYPVNKKLSVKAVRMTYSKDDPKIDMGKQAFGRVRTVAYIKGLRVVSAPSNVLSCKAGPEKCYVLDCAGVKYSAEDAKKGNVENKKRADAHINKLINGTEEAPAVPEGDSEAERIYIHGNDMGTCAKSGMIFFTGAGNESDVKAYELLRSDQPNGTYKKVKSYTLGKDPMLIKCDAALGSYPVYAMQFNSFPPEKEFYYTVRAVSKTGNAPGACGLGFSNKTMPDKVQDLATMDMNATSIELGWIRDDCVKEYWLYRNTSPYGNIEEKGCQGTPLAKVKPGKNLYVLYTDKKVSTDVKYYYFVRPIYDTKKAAKDPMYNAALCSPEVEGKATAKYTTVKNFKASNYSTKRIGLTFNQVKGLSKYRIWRLEVTSADKALTDDMKPDIYRDKPESMSYDEYEELIEKWTLDDWKTFFGKGKYVWHYITEVEGDGTSTTKEKRLTDTVNVGKYYFYLIQGATDKSTSIMFKYSSRVQNKPLAVTNLYADYSGYENGVALIWGRNPKDNDYKSETTVLLSVNGGKSWIVANSNGYIDFSLPRGQLRTYWVSVVYHYGQSDAVASDPAFVMCSLPTRIDVEKREYTIKVGQSVDIKARASMDNGQNPTINKITFERHGDCIEGGNGHYEGKKAGTAHVTLKVAGLSRSVKIKVTN